MGDYLGDTTVVIDYLRGREHVRQLLRQLLEAGNRLCCCDVTINEIYTGMRPHERAGTEQFLRACIYLPTSRAVAEQAGQWRHEYRLTGVTVALADSLIAATAEAHGAILLTANTRHFPFPGVQVQRVLSTPPDAGQPTP